MEASSLIAKLNEICDDENIDIYTFYRNIIKCKNDIREKISIESYESLCKELKCVYYESRLGDGDEDMVLNDCISTLRNIILEIR